MDSGTAGNRVGSGRQASTTITVTLRSIGGLQCSERILIGVAGVLVLFVAVVATRPSAYHVERKLEVAAPADLVFGVLNDLHQFAGVLVLFGSPLEKRDPNMQKTFEGPAAGVGQSYAWSGKGKSARAR